MFIYSIDSPNKFKAKKEAQQRNEKKMQNLDASVEGSIVTIPS